MYPSLYNGPAPWEIYSGDPAVEEPARAPAFSPTPAVGALPTIPLQRPGSGATRTASTDYTQKGNQNSNIARWADAPQIAEITNNIRALPEVQEQQQAQNLNRALFQQELLRKPQLDLATPMANLSDYVQTGRLGGRGPLENAKDSATRIREWAKQTQDDQKDLTNTILSGVAKTKAGMDQNSLMTALLMKSGETMADPLKVDKGSNAPLVNYGKWTKQTQAMLKDDQTASKDAEQLRLAINGNPTAQAEVPTLMTRFLTGAARQAVQEMLLAKGDPSFTARVNQDIERALRGDLTPKMKGEYNQFIHTLLDLHAQGLQAHMDQARALGRGYEIPEGKINDFLKPAYVQPYGDKTTASSKKAPDFNAILQQLMKDGH